VIPEQYQTLLPHLKEHDVAIASRWVKGAKILKHEDWKVIVAGRVYNKIVRLFFGVKVHDTQCGGKVFRRALVQKLAPIVKVKGFGIDLDLLYKAKKLGANIKEVPIQWSHVEEGSKTKLYNSTKMMIKELFQTKFS